MTFYNFVNAVLREINEVEITTVSSTRGIQTSVKDFINKAQRDIINSEVEWPFTVVSQSLLRQAVQRSTAANPMLRLWTTTASRSKSPQVTI